MKTFNSIQALQQQLGSEHIITKNVEETLGGDNGEDLSLMLGGSVFLIEKFEDLREIPTADGVNITKKACVFDVAQWLQGKYILLVDINNNSGGPAYYIPADIADMCTNVQKSVSMTNHLVTGN